jgi:hypothetical protein
MRVSWDDHWRPGSFRARARDLPIEAAWLERIHVPARAAIARFAEEHRLAADGFVHLVFD